MTDQYSRRVIASIQVRMGSSRLPGKVMREVVGKPLLGHLLDRLGRAKLLDGIIVATSHNPENDVIEAYCRQRNLPCYRGSEDDVLDRTLKGLQSMNATVGVEVFGDSPLIDPAIVDEIVATFLSAQPPFDFVGNDLKTTYPPGMEVEVFKVSALADAAELAQDLAIREHGTLYLRQHPDRYRIKNVEAPANYRMPELELEVDTAEDFQVISKIFEHFAPRNDFSLKEITAFLNHRPDLATLNVTVPRRWKQFRDDNG